MKILLQALVVCLVWMGLGLFIGDYIDLRNEVRYLKAKQQNSDDSQHMRNDEPKWTDILIAGLTFVLAGGSVLLYLDAREKGRKELRAYLGIKEQGVRALGDGRYQAYVIIENSGKTPAHQVRMAFHHGIGDADAPEGGFVMGNLSGRMPLGPSAQRVVRRVLEDLRDEDEPRIAIAGQDRRVFAWGRIEYRDIYDVLQHVDFRFSTTEVVIAWARTPQGQQVGNVQGWALNPTEEGNDAS